MPVQSGRITRDELSLADLPICDGFLVLDQDGPGDLSVTWRRQRATSPFVAGSVLVGSVRDDSTMSLRFHVLGSSTADVRARAEALIAAVTQTSWQLYLSVDDEDFGWQCEPADYTVGMTSAYVGGYALRVNLSVPRQPISLLGEF